MNKNVDIVDELRSHEGSAHRDGFVCARCRGADEIERLREQIWQYEHDLVLPGSSDEIERLRGLINNWVDAMEHDEVPYDGTIYPRAVNALREAVKRPFVD